MPEPVATEASAGAPADVGSNPSTRRGLSATVRNLTLSIGLVALIIFAALAISWRPDPDPVRPVDALPVATAVAAAAGFPVLYPEVPASWRATSARWEPTAESADRPVWFNGWITDTGEYAAVVQSKATGKGFVAEHTGGAYPADAADVGVAVPGWQAYWSRDGETRSLVRERNGVTTIVTATLDWPGLVAFRDRLAPVQVDAVRTG